MMKGIVEGYFLGPMGIGVLSEVEKCAIRQDHCGRGLHNYLLALVLDLPYFGSVYGYHYRYHYYYHYFLTVYDWLFLI